PLTLDNFFKDKENKIDVVKVDVEGAEEIILDGMRGIIEKNNLKLFIEFFPKRVEQPI
ncbi:MAG TPA: FkbM family methyltransferase, partial [Elusimicrobia bacterium]|nr:FkbM family methyltransferase [Elusimicrobiota bacterium]